MRSVLAFMAISGPSASKNVKRRVELIKERHGDAITGNAQAQIRKLFADRGGGKIEGFASTLIPKPALLRIRLEQTGKNITLGKYALVCIGIIALVVVGLTLRGAPFILSLMLGLFFGVGGPHFVIGRMIKSRINKFNTNFPDAIELMVRGLRSGLPITETLGIVASEIKGPVGVEFRMAVDKMKIGRTMEAALQETADRLGTAEFQFFVITLAIQRETGGNLAETLSNLADVLRKRAQMKLKIRAMSSESKASAYIVGSLAIRRVQARVHDQPPLHGRLLHRSAPDGRRHRRHDLDGHRRRDHGQDGQLRDLREQFRPCRPRPLQRPHILGFDVIWIATILSAVAAFAVLLAIYAATTVKDPMARRVKALNERREQLKAGIVASTNKRKSLRNRNQAADNVRQLLGQFKMLQDDQVKKTQIRLMQAGIRTKDLAFFIIFARFVLPVILGLAAVVLIYVMNHWPEWGGFRRYMTVAGVLVGSYKAPDIWLKNKVTKRSNAIRKGFQMRSTCLSSAPKPASPSTPPSIASPRSSARPIRSWATSSALPRSNWASSTNAATPSRISPSASTWRRFGASSRP